jgi:uncharacterized protein (DUF4415 family)
MRANKNVSKSYLGTDLEKLDAHRVQDKEYAELPELNEDMMARGRVNKGGRPRSQNPKQLITIRLPEDVIQRWRATGPGWQTRMAQKLSQ